MVLRLYQKPEMIKKLKLHTDKILDINRYNKVACNDDSFFLNCIFELFKIRMYEKVRSDNTIRQKFSFRKNIYLSKLFFPFYVFFIVNLFREAKDLQKLKSIKGNRWDVLDVENHSCI